MIIKDANTDHLIAGFCLGDGRVHQTPSGDGFLETDPNGNDTSGSITEKWLEQSQSPENSKVPFSRAWWWDVLLTHLYHCKIKYTNEEEMRRDGEVTNFIIQRIERKIDSP